MPTINLNRKEFERLVGKKLQLEQLKERISMLGTDLEEITAEEIIVEVFPDRPDMLSEQGFARAFAAFIGHKTGLRKYVVKKSGEKVIVDASVKSVRPFTACAIVKNLKLDHARIQQMMQLQEKLHITFGRSRRKIAIGIYPLDRIKMPITFKGMNPEKIHFKPLEYHKELSGLEILQLHPKGKEYGHLLDSQNVFPVFEDAAGKILSMPPIINSDDTGKVETSTRDMFVECSGFDFHALQRCLNIVVAALADMGGQIYSMEIIDGKKKTIAPNLEPWKMKVAFEQVNRLLGLQLKESEIKKLLERMGMGLGYQNKQALIPAYRADVLHPVDVIEDVAIAYGYETFTEEIPKIATIASRDAQHEMREKLVDILVGLGLLEVVNYHLSNQAEQQAFEHVGCVEIASALSQDYRLLRANLLPGLLKVFSQNKHHEYPQKIFELGEVFSRGKSETGVVEKQQLSFALTHANTNFTEAKQMLDALAALLGWQLKLVEKDIPGFIPGRCADVLLQGEKCGVIGEVHPEVLNKFQLDYPVVAVEIGVGGLIG